MRCRKLMWLAVLFLIGSSNRVTAGEAAGDDGEPLHQLILPGEEDSQWMRVSWMPATDIWAARRKAASEGRPILLWYMAGEPLGPC